MWFSSNEVSLTMGGYSWLALAVHTFYELGRGPTTVSSTYIKSHQVLEIAANPVYFLKGT